MHPENSEDITAAESTCLVLDLLPHGASVDSVVVDGAAKDLLWHLVSVCTLAQTSGASLIKTCLHHQINELVNLTQVKPLQSEDYKKQI